MPDKQSKIGSILISIVEIIIGIILLISPVKFTKIVIIAFGIILVIAGAVSIINYFMSKPVEAVVTENLAKGISEVVVGIFFIVKREWLITTFPLLTVVYGVITLFMGIKKFATTINLIRLKVKSWGWVLLSSIITIAFAIIILGNPFSSTAVLWTFVGVTLIVEAVIDILITLFSKN